MSNKTYLDENAAKWLGNAIDLCYHKSNAHAHKKTGIDNVTFSDIELAIGADAIMTTQTVSGSSVDIGCLLNFSSGYVAEDINLDSYDFKKNLIGMSERQNNTLFAGDTVEIEIVPVHTESMDNPNELGLLELVETKKLLSDDIAAVDQEFKSIEKISIGTIQKTDDESIDASKIYYQMNISLITDSLTIPHFKGTLEAWNALTDTDKARFARGLVTIINNNNQDLSAYNGEREEFIPIPDNESLTKTIQPNVLYIFVQNGGVKDLTLDFAPYIDGVVCDYHFVFASGETPTTLTLPAGMIGTPEIKANTRYELSIIHGLVAYKEWGV